MGEVALAARRAQGCRRALAGGNRRLNGRFRCRAGCDAGTVAGPERRAAGWDLGVHGRFRSHDHVARVAQADRGLRLRRGIFVGSWVRPTAVFGSVHRPDGELQPTAGSLDLDVIEILTEEYWSTDLEVFVAHDPDLIISTAWSGDDPNSVWASTKRSSSGPSRSPRSWPSTTAPG